MSTENIEKEMLTNDLQRLVEDSPFREKIEQLSHPNADYRNSNCHGTSLWVTNMDVLVYKMWQDYVKNKEHEIHPLERVSTPLKDKPGNCSELPLALFLKESELIGHNQNSGLAAFYQYTGRTAPLTQIERDCGIQQAHHLIHSAIYIGKIGNEGIFFHQENGNQPFGFTTIREEKLLRRSSSKYPVYAKIFAIDNRVT